MWLRPTPRNRPESSVTLRIGQVREYGGKIIAKAEGMDATQVRRIMQLTLLASDVIERLVGTPDIVLERLRRSPWPNGWDKQLQVLSLAA
jgi:hypothetical protein